MPIRRYVRPGTVFDPEALTAMGKALEGAVATLGIDGNEGRRETVAQFIIELALTDKSLDAAALRDRAVSALSGPPPHLRGARNADRT
jgi:hypothetical protein